MPFGAAPLAPRYLRARTLAASAHRRRGGSSGNASTQRRSGGTRDRIAARAAPREGVPTTQLPRAGAWSHGQDRRWTSGYCVCVIARCSRPGAASRNLSSVDSRQPRGTQHQSRTAEFIDQRLGGGDGSRIQCQRTETRRGTECEGRALSTTSTIQRAAILQQLKRPRREKETLEACRRLLLGQHTADSDDDRVVEQPHRVTRPCTPRCPSLVRCEQFGNVRQCGRCAFQLSSGSGGSGRARVGRTLDGGAWSATTTWPACVLATGTASLPRDLDEVQWDLEPGSAARAGFPVTRHSERLAR